MNDRYLYKAKRIDNGEWVEGALFDGEKYCVIGQQIKFSPYIENECKIVGYMVDPSNICKCTGLKDKNGKLIWENDVVRCIDKNNDLEFIAVIEFGNPNAFYSWGYQLRHIKGDKPNLNILLWIDMEDTGATCEVIGNIFDNPELLEVGE